MNFPDVPIDEKLFESNEMMREYWDRSTQNRGVHFVPEVRAEDNDEFAELRSATAMEFEANDDVVVVQAPLTAKSTDAIVKPKAAASTVDAWIFWLLLSAVLIVIVYALYKRHDTRRY
jgi:hypothetical protein